MPLAAPLAAFVTHRLLFSVLSKSLQSRSASSLCFLHSHYLIPPLNCLSGTLMILKSACSYNASYIDRLISVFMRSLQKMVREHLSPQQANPGVTETNTGTFKDQSRKILHKVCWSRSMGIFLLKFTVQNISDWVIVCKALITFFPLFF